MDSFVFFLRQTTVQLRNHLRRCKALSVKFFSVCQCAYNQINVFKLNRKFFHFNALPFFIVVFEEDVRRIRSPPLVVGEAAHWRGHEVSRPLAYLQHHQVEVGATDVFTEFVLPSNGLVCGGHGER